MRKFLAVEKFSFGLGDRFAHQAKAQLQACIMVAKQGVEIVPVWNKSNREHTVNGWTSEQFVSALRHDPKNNAFNPSFRQLLHVGFKIAAKKGARYLSTLKKHEAVIAKNVTENLFERHMKPLLPGQ